MFFKSIRSGWLKVPAEVRRILKKRFALCILQPMLVGLVFSLQFGLWAIIGLFSIGVLTFVLQELRVESSVDCAQPPVVTGDEAWNLCIGALVGFLLAIGLSDVLDLLFYLHVPIGIQTAIIIPYIISMFSIVYWGIIFDRVRFHRCKVAL